MKKSTIVITLVILAALVAGGVLFAMNGSDEPADTSQETTTTEQPAEEPETTPEAEEPSDDNASAADEVEIEDFAFGPQAITVKKGTTVTWTNEDDVQHNVVPDNGDSDAFKGGPLLSKGKSYSFTFNTPGTYTYHCGPHPQMTGTVTVTE